MIKKKDDDMTSTGLLVSFLIAGILLGFAISWVIPDEGTVVLGQAICEEEYGMDFKFYVEDEGFGRDGKLKCKLKVNENEVMYDGLKVELSNK